MSKYDAFKAFLENSDAGRLRLSFSKIEEILGFKLPHSKIYPAWWSNNESNSVMTKVWLSAGYRSEDVDIAGQKVSFVRQGKKPESDMIVGNSPIFGCMKGTTFVAPGVDLTEPADPSWGDVYADAPALDNADVRLIAADDQLTISERIRELDRLGLSRADIARSLGKRYQHVRNVLEDQKRKAG